MKRLLQDSFLLELVEDIYAAGCYPSEWPAFVTKVQSAVPGSAVHALFDIEGTQILFNSASAGIPDDFVRSYLGGYYRINPYNDVFSRLPTGKIYTSAELGPPGWLKKDMFFNDWLLPAGDFTHGSGVVIERAPGRQLRVTFDLPTKLAHSENLAAKFLARIKPHLSRAFLVNERLGAAAATHQSLAALVDRMTGAAFLLDSACRVIAANAGALTLIRGRKTLRQESSGRLLFSEPRDQSTYQKMIEQNSNASIAGTSNGFRLKSPDFPEGASVMVLPLHAKTAGFAVYAAAPRALIVITETSDRNRPTIELLQTVFALTPAESAAVLELCAGYSIQDAADRLSLARLTVRNQISSAMGKMGVHRQAELIAAVTQLAPQFKLRD
jgi:DNA-binding CsgD family transcriptional regulator